MISRGRMKNENLNRLRRKVTLLMRVSAGFKKARTQTQSYSREEIDKMTANFRKRVQEIEQRKTREQL